MVDKSSEWNAPDKLDPLRLQLCDGEFDEMDLDSSNTLNLYELSKALKDETVTGSKRQAVEGLRDSIAGLETNVLDNQHDSVPVIHAWNPLDVATNCMSKAEFKKIDINGDGILSKPELISAQFMDLSETCRLSAKYLASAEKYTDPRGLVSHKGVSDWHNLDDKYRNLSRWELRQYCQQLTKDIQNSKEHGLDEQTVTGYNDELLARDQISAGSKKEQLSELLILQKALRENRSVKRNEDGQLLLTDTPLSDHGRYVAHMDVRDAIKEFDMLRRDRTNYGIAMYGMDNVEKADQLFKQAIKDADLVTDLSSDENSEVTMVDIINNELAQVKIDNEVLGDRHTFRSDVMKVLKAPIDTRIEKAKCHMGAIDGEGKYYFDSSDPNYDPDKAQVLIDQARNKVISLLGHDPRPVKLRYSGQCKESWQFATTFNPINLFYDVDNNGKSDVIENLNSYPWWGTRLVEPVIKSTWFPEK